MSLQAFPSFANALTESTLLLFTRKQIYMALVTFDNACNRLNWRRERVRGMLFHSIASHLHLSVAFGAIMRQVFLSELSLMLLKKHKLLQ